MVNELIAYCGPAAVPEDVWLRWNTDPVLIAALAALAFWVTRRAANPRAGWAAIVLMALVFILSLIHH